MIRVHTRDGRHFRVSSFDFITRIAHLKNKDGNIISTIYFTDESIVAVEQTKDGEYVIE